MRRLKVFGTWGEEAFNVPKSLSRLSNLRILNLGDSSIGAPYYDCNSSSLKTLKNLTPLHNLEELWLSSMDIEYFPEELGQLSQLKRLILGWSFCHSRILPAWIGQLSKLEYLNLASMNGGTDFEDFDWADWSASFQHLPTVSSMSKLDLSGNKSRMIDFDELARVFPNLKSLYLSENCFMDLPNSISKLQHLEFIDISSNEGYVNGDWCTLTTVPSSLLNHPTISKIHLSDGFDLSTVDLKRGTSMESICDATIYVRMIQPYRQSVST